MPKKTDRPLRALLPVSGQKEPVITMLRRVRTPSGRAREGLFVVEGAELCRRALRYGGHLESLVMTSRFAQSDEGMMLRRAVTCPVYGATLGLIGKALEAKPTPDCVGLTRRVLHPWRSLIDDPGGLWIGVDEGESADNLGMLLRSAEASAVSGVLLGNGTVEPFARRVVRGSRGAVFSLPMALEAEMAVAVEAARGNGIQVVATSANTEASYTAVDFTKPTLIIVGNEHRGVSQAVLDRADHLVTIPMLGRINSLNISVAASVVLFEAGRQRAASRTP